MAKDMAALAVGALRFGSGVSFLVAPAAATKLWGDKEFNRLDKISVAVPHPDAAAAIIKGGTEITAHFGNPPFQEQELAGKPCLGIDCSCDRHS